MKRSFRTPASVLLGLCLAIGFGGVAQADEDISVTRMSVQRHEAMTDLGSIAIELVVDARDDIARSDLLRARRTVGHSERLLARLRSQSPALQLSDSLKTAAQKVTGTGGSDVLYPIYEQLDEYEQVTEDTDVRTNINMARAKLAKGDVKMTVTMLERAQGEIDYSEVDIPLDATYQKVLEAHRLLIQKKPGPADAKLKSALGDIRTLVDKADLDLDEAVVEKIRQ